MFNDDLDIYIDISDICGLTCINDIYKKQLLDFICVSCFSQMCIVSLFQSAMITGPAISINVNNDNTWNDRWRQYGSLKRDQHRLGTKIWWRLNIYHCIIPPKFLRFNIGSGIGLVPLGNKPLPDPILIRHIWFMISNFMILFLLSMISNHYFWSAFVSNL